MEPLFFKAENEQALIELQHQMPGFNGAAFFQSGKSWYAGQWKSQPRPASMEPLFFKAENAPLAPPAGFYWKNASMEPLFFKAENVVTRYRVFTLESASMEPLFFKAENLGGRR